MEHLEDYDFTLHYHLGKENVVADALSRNSQGVLASVASREWQMLETVGQFGLQYSNQAQVREFGSYAIPIEQDDPVLGEGHGDIVHQGLGTVRYE